MAQPPHRDVHSLSGKLEWCLSGRDGGRSNGGLTGANLGVVAGVVPVKGELWNPLIPTRRYTRLKSNRYQAKQACDYLIWI